MHGHPHPYRGNADRPDDSSIPTPSSANSAAPPTSPSEAALPSVAGEDPDFNYSSVARRDFLKVAGASAGAFLVGGANLAGGSRRSRRRRACRSCDRARRRTSSSSAPERGAAGRRSTCARWARRSRSSTRTDRATRARRRATRRAACARRTATGPASSAKLWMLWARESMKRWIAFDDEWGREFRLNLFHVTGDLIMRTEWDNFQLRTQGLVGQEQDPVPDPQARRRPQGVPGDLDRRHHGDSVRAGRRRRSRAPRCADGRRGLREARRQDRHRPRVAIKDLEWHGSRRFRSTRARRSAPTRSSTRRSVARKDVPGALREEDARADGLRLLFRDADQRSSVHVSESSELQLPGRDRMGGAPGGQPRLPRARRRARAGSGVAAARSRRRSRRPANGADARIGNANVAGATPQGGQPGGAAANATAADAGAAGDGRGGRGGGGGGRGATAERSWRRGGGDSGHSRTSRRRSRIRIRAIAGRTQARIDGSRRFVAHRFPLLKDAPIAQTHACHYESTSSGNFIIDKHPQLVERLDRRGRQRRGVQVRPQGRRLHVASASWGTRIPQDKVFTIPEKDYEPPPTPADSTKKSAADSAAAKSAPGKPPALR